MPEQTIEPAAPYARLAASYDRLVEWVIAAWGESPRDRAADFLEAVWAERGQPVHRVLEICCGTGLTLTELAGRGYRVTGLDRSAAMLEQAGRRLGPRVPLVRAELPYIPLREPFDAVISAAAGLSYQPSDAALGETFASVRRVLPPGGTFVFDLLSRTLLDRSLDQLGPAPQAAELDGVSYIWTFERPSDASAYDLTYVQFLRDDATGTYTRSREVHRMYARDPETVRELALRAGFSSAEVFDNYSRRPAGPETLYETWLLVRDDGD